jgi:hypothetical protein
MPPSVSTQGNRISLSSSPRFRTGRSCSCSCRRRVAALCCHCAVQTHCRTSQLLPGASDLGKIGDRSGRFRFGAVSPGRGEMDARRGAMGGARTGPAALSRSGELAVEPPEVRQLAQLAPSLLYSDCERQGLGSARWRAAAVVRSIPSKLTDAAQNQSRQGATCTSPSAE